MTSRGRSAPTGRHRGTAITRRADRGCRLAARGPWQSGPARQAPARPPPLLGAGTGRLGIALLATSAWLISRAAQHPSVVALGVAIIGVRFFAISAALFRYGERLVGHDAALRALADLRVRVYERLERLAPDRPAGLPAEETCWPASSRTWTPSRTSCSGSSLRAVWPWSSASRPSGLIWYLLPAAGLVLAAGSAPRPRPWCRGTPAAWPGGGRPRQAPAEGELSTHVVDLLEGAPELVAFGATDAELARVAAADAELTRIATATRPHRRQSGPG